MSAILNACIVCGAAARDLDRHGDVVEVKCERCGHYKYTGSVYPNLSSRDLSKQRPIISGWIWSQNRVGAVPTITTENIANLLALTPLPFLERAKRLLIYMADKSEKLGTDVNVYVNAVGGMVETFENSEIEFLSNFLIEENLVRSVQGKPILRVTPKGFLKADEWRATVGSGIQGFVAMWFDPTTEDAWKDGLQRGIEVAGYSALRINMKEHTNKICDEIISEIRRSRFVVADFTGHRGGVYYEAGYAAGRGVPVVWSCRKDQIKDLHFDIRQYNCIDWETPAELARRLESRICAVIGDGPLRQV